MTARAPILSKIKIHGEIGMATDEALRAASEANSRLDMRAICRDAANAALTETLAVLAHLTQEKGPVEPPDSIPRVPFEVVQLDYMQTGDQIKMLTDIRFKLLAFVPPIVGAGVTLLSSKVASTAADHILIGSIGVLGFMLTLGIVLYDLRNSQLYNAQVHRAKVLEQILGCIGSGKEKLWPTPSTGGGKAYGISGAHQVKETGGVHTQRAIALDSFLRQRISHGPALSLVYGVALGAWVFPIVRDLGAGFWMTISNFLPTHGIWITIRNFHPTDGNGLTTSGVALLVAIGGAIFFRARMNAEDRGWPVTHLGYDEPKEPSWRKGYEDKIAQEEIKRKRRWLFKVVARNKSSWLYRQLERRRAIGKLEVIIRNNESTTIAATNRMRRRLRDSYPKSKLEITETGFLVGCENGKVVIKVRIPYVHFKQHPHHLEELIRKESNEIEFRVVLSNADLIGIDTENLAMYSNNVRYYLYFGGGTIEIGSQLPASRADLGVEPEQGRRVESP
jgi:hypothetical protein